MLISQMKMIRWKAKPTILFPTSKAIGYCWIEVSHIALGCVPQNIFSDCQLFVCTYRHCLIYFFTFFLHGVFHWLHNAVEYRVRLGFLPVVLCILYSLYVYWPKKKEQCQLQPANSEEEEKTMTTFSTLFVVARLCWNPFATRLCENKSANVSRHDWLARFGRSMW